MVPRDKYAQYADSLRHTLSPFVILTRGKRSVKYSIGSFNEPTKQEKELAYSLFGKENVEFDWTESYNLPLKIKVKIPKSKS